MSANSKAERELLAMVLSGELQREAIAYAENTRSGYRADWHDFTSWCKLQRLESLPAAAQTVLLYSHAQLASGRKVSTAIHRLSAINSYHQAAGYPKPADAVAWPFLLAVRRMRGEQPEQKAALTVEELRGMSKALPETPHGLRDRSVLTLGFASGLRRSNLVALDLADVDFREEGLVLTIRREKQDRRGEGRVVGVIGGRHAETCPIRTLQDWLKQRGSSPGPLFTPVYAGHALLKRLKPAHVARIVKAAAAAAGLDSARLSGHSLRSGMATSAIENGAGELIVAAHLGHKNLSTTRRYFRRTDPFRANASGLLGL